MRHDGVRDLVLRQASNATGIQCTVVTADLCRTLQGLYRGNGSACTADACTPPPAPTGATP